MNNVLSKLEFVELPEKMWLMYLQILKDILKSAVFWKETWY